MIQPSLDPFLPSLDPTRLNSPSTDPLGALLSLQLTSLTDEAGGEKTALGVNWGHVLGDGHACVEFIRALGRAYELDGALGEGERERPNFGPHVRLIEKPDEEVLRKWETGILWPSFGVEDGWGKCEFDGRSEVVADWDY